MACLCCRPLPSGKTWTIAFAVRVLLARGASVLITSYTHSAVDNLLLKLIGEGVACLRVGNPSSVHPGVREHCVNYDGKAETTAAYSELVASARWGCVFFNVCMDVLFDFSFCEMMVTTATLIFEESAGLLSVLVVSTRVPPLKCVFCFGTVGGGRGLYLSSGGRCKVGMDFALRIGWMLGGFGR